MRSNIKYLIFSVLIILIFAVSSVSANDLENVTVNVADNESLDFGSFSDDVILDESEITVNDWNDLQLYCSKSDKNYVLKLKENTNYYPTDPSDESYKIQVNNNVTILGSSGAYIGDDSQDARPIEYLAINVPENSGNGITLKGVTFKWISTQYQPNAVFLQMAGNSNNYIENCKFANSTLDGGHSSFVYLLRGYASIVNSTFTDIISDFGCVSIYDPEDDTYGICTGARMDITDSYFEGNYARTAPGCINNCGVLVVSNTTFYRNTAFQWAGAIHTHGGANTTIYDSNFTDNLAGWNGGALCTYAYLQVYNTIFIGNNCTTNNGGGAIFGYNYLSTPHIYVKDSLFEDNENLCWSLTEMSTEGTGRGGAISILNGDINILNSTFIKNSASIGTAICINNKASKLLPSSIIGNSFINHTRIGDVLVVDSRSLYEIRDNAYLNNSIVFSKLRLDADEQVGDEVTLHIDASLKNTNYYDLDILEKSPYYVYVDGKYYESIVGKDFTLNLKNLQNCQVYVIPAISNSKSNEVSVGTPKEYIYVSQKYGNNTNNGSSRQSSVATITRACELAKSCGNIVIMDGTFSESDIAIGYDLTIAGEDDVKFTGSMSNSIFTISNSSNFKISNIAFDGITFLNKNTGVIRQSSGFTVVDNCVFNGNGVSSSLSGNVLIEAKKIEVHNSKFTNNNAHMMLIKSDEFSIDNCTFLDNAASNTVYFSLISTVGENTGIKGTITNSVFKSNTVKYGCVYFGARNNILAVSNTMFIANKVATASDHSSCIKIVNSPKVQIYSSVFMDNVDLGSKAAPIYVDGGDAQVYVSNSIIIHNTYENSNNVVFSASTSSNLKVYIDLNGNWWGNTDENYADAPAAYASACDSWLFLNASANSTSISKNQKVQITYDLNNQASRSGNVSFYDASKLNAIRFVLEATGGVAGDSELTLVKGIAQTIYTLTSYEGSLTADYNGFKAILNFTHTKIRPEMTINVNDVHVGESAILEIGLPDDVGGNLTVKNQTKVISDSKTTFTLDNLAAGENVIDVIYSGDEYWLSSVEKVTVNVSKYDSMTKIVYDNVEVGDDLTLNIDVTDAATGNVTLIINNKTETLTLSNSKAQYIIKSIARGDYNITAIYNGDSKYSSSKDNVRMGVGKVNPVFSVIVLEISYGQDAVVNVALNNNATGIVYASIDDKNNASRLENGEATLTISGLGVGLKTAYVNYDGDEYYNSFAASVQFSVSKADTTLTVNANDIRVGADETIEVIVPGGVTGNVTIVCGENIITKAINVLGKVVWTVYDLPVGQYEVSATLISENYNNIENTTEFTVSDYSPSQWPNQGYDVGNDGKSPYDIDSNGAIIWTYETNGEVTKNIVIDSEGNICIVTASGVYSIDAAGNERWHYSYVNENISGIAISREVVIIPISGNSLFFVNQTTGQRYGYSHIYQASSPFVPVVDSNANVYVSTDYQNSFEDYKLAIVPYSIWDYGGNPVLISLGKSRPASAPVIVGDSYAVVACIDGIKIIDLSKNEISSTISGNTQGIRPVAGSDSIVYAVLNNNIQAMTPQGNVIWKKAIASEGGQLALDEENGLYFINSAGNLYRYGLLDGSEKIISSLNFTSGMLVGNDGNVYIGLNEMLYAFDGAGNVLWKSDMGDIIVGTPVMNEDGTIYLTTSNALKAVGSADLADANMVVSIDNISTGENATVIINVSDDLTGIIYVEIDSKEYDKVISGKTIVISVPNLSAGHKTAKITYSGDKRFKSKEVSCEFGVFGQSQIIAENSTSYYGSRYVIALKDMQGNAIAGEKLTVNMGTNEYNLTTDKNGEVAIDLAISPGNYQVISTFAGNDYLKPSTKTTELNISSTIQSGEMKRGYNSGIDFKATFLTGDGSPLADSTVSFIVNGEIYNVTTDSNGVAVLNKKLAVGSYDIGILNPGTGENATQKTTIVKRITNNKDLTMDYLDGSYFKVLVVGDDGNYVGKNQVVTFKINGKSYTAKTDASGYAKIKINLVPKTYSVSTEYKGYKVSNKIVVKQVLKAKNVSKKKAKSYKFQATLKTSKGKAISGKKLTFKIKNKKYTAKTNKKGVATVTIKLNLKVGKYTITTTYSKTSIKNKLTVKK